MYCRSSRTSILKGLGYDLARIILIPFLSQPKELYFVLFGLYLNSEVEQLVAREIHNLKVVGSSPTLATIKSLIKRILTGCWSLFWAFFYILPLITQK